MKRSLIHLAGFLAMTAGSGFANPLIQSLSPDGQLVWTNDVSGNVGIIERSASMEPGSWEPFFYEQANPGAYTTVLPATDAPQSFYRVAIQTNIPDPTLVLHLSFDNTLSNGIVLDASGYANHGLQFSATNWPLASLGPDGRRAGAFTRYGSISGDYVAVPYAPELDHLSRGTLLVWAYYTANSYGASALVDAGWWEDANSWNLGRNYATSTKFTVSTGVAEAVVVAYPDTTATYDTGGWHYYGVTWDGTNFIGYFDGLPFSTNTQAGYPELTVGGNYKWIAVGCRNHDGTPQWGDDLYPNNGWMGGWIDDVRLYSRALNAAEVLARYASFDTAAPSTPTNLTARASSSSQIELRWSPSTDNFRIDGYRVWRNGTLIGEIQGNLYVDSNLAPDTTNSYTVEARDVGGNLSGTSDALQAATPAGSGVEVILDEADGLPWITTVGTWSLRWTTDAYRIQFIQDDNTGKGTKSVTYRPLLPEAGTYGVYIWYPYRANGATSIPVDIVSTTFTNTVLINQTLNGGKWNLLTTQSLPAGTNTYVRIRNDGTSGYVEADAVRFLK